MSGVISAKTVQALRLVSSGMRPTLAAKKCGLPSSTIFRALARVSAVAGESHADRAGRALAAAGWSLPLL